MSIHSQSTNFAIQSIISILEIFGKFGIMVSYSNHTITGRVSDVRTMIKENYHKQNNYDQKITFIFQFY